MTPTMNLKIHSGELTKAHETDAGFDIHASEDTTIFPSDKASVPTNLTLTLPLCSVGIVKPRSGNSFGKHIETGAGVIDEDYSGELRVKLYNFGDNPFHIKKGDRIAQLCIFYRPTIRVTTSNNAIYNAPKDSKLRGDNGFGSTGIS